MAKAKRKEGLSFAQLSDEAKDKALGDFLNTEDYQDLFCETEKAYFAEKLAARGVEVRDWHWSVGGYRSNEYVSVYALIEPMQWLQWNLRLEEARATGPFKREEDRPCPSPMLLAIETLLLSGLYDELWYVRTSVRNESHMYIDYDGSLLDGIADSGPLAGADTNTLRSLYRGVDLDALIEKQVQEICDEALDSLRKEYEYRTSMEYFEEMCECNDWFFTEEGMWVL